MTARRLLLVGLVATALSSCQSSDPADVEASCESVEAPGYPTLEKVAEEEFGTLRSSVSRVSRCEDQGVPGAQVVVQVSDWDQRSEVRRHLEQAGWAPSEDGSTLTSPDGSVIAQPVRSRSEGTTSAGAYLYLSQ